VRMSRSFRRPSRKGSATMLSKCCDIGRLFGSPARGSGSASCRGMSSLCALGLCSRFGRDDSSGTQKTSEEPYIEGL
jgi:hypothetical protein